MMNLRLSEIAAIVLFASLSASVMAAVTIDFVEPEDFSDIGDRKADHERNLALIESFFTQEAEACLPEGNQLAVKILDIDLAGQFEWWHRPPGFRVMRGIHWPRIKLEYVWRDGTNELVGQGSELLADMDYLRSSAQRSSITRPLRHEQAMIRQWIHDNICN